MDSNMFGMFLIFSHNFISYYNEEPKYNLFLYDDCIS